MVRKTFIFDNKYKILTRYHRQNTEIENKVRMWVVYAEKVTSNTPHSNASNYLELGQLFFGFFFTNETVG